MVVKATLVKILEIGIFLNRLHIVYKQNLFFKFQMHNTKN